MKLAIMQPYLFPYVGYYQLVKAVDRFVIYDDVNFIKQGWINRNNILVQEKANLFTLPLSNASSFIKINEAIIHEKMFTSWKVKFLRTIEQSYKKAPHFERVYGIVQDVLNSEDSSISKMAVNSIVIVSQYLKLKTEFVLSSSVYDNNNLSGKERVIDICKKENAQHYINPSGGQELYDKSYFEERGIALNFIKSLPVNYKQFNNEFVPWLSIIDVMMFNTPEDIDGILQQYILI